MLFNFQPTLNTWHGWFYHAVGTRDKYPRALALPPSPNNFHLNYIAICYILVRSVVYAQLAFDLPLSPLPPFMKIPFHDNGPLIVSVHFLMAVVSLSVILAIQRIFSA